MLFKVRLKELRECRNLSQKQVADACGLSHTCVCQLETGARNPTGTTLFMLADFFEVSTDYLLGREDDFGNISVYRTESSSALSGNEQKIIDAIRENAPFNPVEWVSLYASLPTYMQESIFAELKGMHLGYKASKNGKAVNK